MAIGNIIFSTSSTTITAGGIIDASDFERSTNLQVDNVSGNINISGGINTGSVSNLGSNANVKISGGTSGQTIITDGSGNLSWGSSYAGPNVQIFTSGTTSWTVPSGITRVMVYIHGGGGGGGGSQTQSYLYGGGGGNGGVGVALITGLTPGNSVTVTVGAGGAGGQGYFNSTPTAGTAGGTSSFGAFITATGGAGGAAGTAGGANGANGTITTPGTILTQTSRVVSLGGEVPISTGPGQGNSYGGAGLHGGGAAPFGLFKGGIVYGPGSPGGDVTTSGGSPVIPGAGGGSNGGAAGNGAYNGGNFYWGGGGGGGGGIILIW